MGGVARAGTLLIVLAMAAAAVAVVASPSEVSNRTRGPARQAAGTTDDLREVFPGVWIDLQRRLVEFDGVVPIDCHDPATPDVWLEVLVCRPDTREHEAVVMTEALASHVHAALLLLDIEPGRPGEWSWQHRELRAHPPQGPPLRVLVRAPGEGRWRPLGDWALHAETGASLTETLAEAGGGFVFAGSRLVPFAGGERYDADYAGTLVGLTAFGSETVAATEMWSPESAMMPPLWLADARAVPPALTPVRVRIAAAAGR